MRQAWLSEMLMLGGLILAALVVGLATGAVAWMLFLAVTAYLVRSLSELHRLERWLRHGRKRNPPESWGVWGEVFEAYYRLQRRYYKRKKRLGRVIREFRESTAAMPDGTLVLDSELRIQWFNDAARETLHLVPQRDLGQSIVNLVRAPQFKHYLQSGQYEQGVSLPAPADNARTLSARLIAYGESQYLLLFRDVTQLQRLQAMRRDFVANASHELKSPLTVLTGYLDSMADSAALGPDWLAPLEEMQAQCKRMNSLINDLLELSRLETEAVHAPSDEAVDVPALGERIVQAARAEDSQQHQFSFEALSPSGLLGIERELYSAFSNLIINAMRYTGPDGRIQARWFRRDSGELVFEVIDDGIGIEEKHLPFITQRFYRIDSSHGRRVGGTGLGLAIVKHVLQRHHGRLEIVSRIGEGSTFRCVFPASRGCKLASNGARSAS